MSKFLVETYYTCTFKIIHELSELDEKKLADIDNRKDGKVEIIDVTVNNRKTKKTDDKNSETKTSLDNVKISHSENKTDNKKFQSQLISNFLIWVKNLKNKKTIFFKMTTQIIF